MDNNDRSYDLYLERLSGAFRDADPASQALAMMLATGQEPEGSFQPDPARFDEHAARRVDEAYGVTLATLAIALGEQTAFKKLVETATNLSPAPLLRLGERIATGSRNRLDSLVHEAFENGWDDLPVLDGSSEQVENAIRPLIAFKIYDKLNGMEENVEEWVQRISETNGRDTVQSPNVLSVPAASDSVIAGNLEGGARPTSLMTAAVLTPLPTFLARPARARRPVAGPFAERGVVTLLVGTPGAGKSTLALQVGCAVAAGVSFAGLDVPRAERVVYLNAEDGSDVVKDRFEAIGRELDAAARERIDVVECRDRERLMGKVIGGRANVNPWGATFKAAIVARAPALVIIDPLSMVHDLDENLNADMTHFVSFLHEIAREGDCAIVLVHHSGKDVGKTPGLAASRGASALPAAVRSMYVLSDVGDGKVGQVRLTHAKANYHRLSETVALTRTSIELPGGGTVGALVSASETPARG